MCTILSTSDRDCVCATTGFALQCEVALLCGAVTFRVSRLSPQLLQADRRAGIDDQLPDRADSVSTFITSYEAWDAGFGHPRTYLRAVHTSDDSMPCLVHLYLCTRSPHTMQYIDVCK